LASSAAAASVVDHEDRQPEGTKVPNDARQRLQ
jgi:hypothetical protein